MGNAARAAPDGYTIVFVSTSYIVNPSLMRRSRTVLSRTSRPCPVQTLVYLRQIFVRRCQPTAFAVYTPTITRLIHIGLGGVCVMTEVADFTCPRCASRYKLVRVHADPQLPSRVIHCTVCKEPFAPRDGERILKYFLVDRANKHNGTDLRMNHPPKGRPLKPRS